MTVTIASLRLDTRLADEAARALGVKTRTEAVHAALREIVALQKFKVPRFEGNGEWPRHLRHVDLH